MNTRYLLMVFMIVVGIAVGVFAMYLKMPTEELSGTIALVNETMVPDENISRVQDAVSVPSPRPAEKERAAALAVEPEVTTGQPDKVAYLSALLDQEVSRRHLLETRLASLQTKVSKLESSLVDRLRSLQGERKEDNEAQAEVEEDPEKVSEARFLKAGFDRASRAQLLKRASEIEMERLYLRHQARREGWHRTSEYYDTVRELRGRMKNELGEDTYDRFLYASERSNRLLVDSVMESSPAQQSGLQQGDIIFRYDGTRIFSRRDLRDATGGGMMGETVPVEILRGGEVIEVRLPRGPLGVRMDRATIQP